MTNVQKFNAQARALMPHFAAELDAAQFEWATAPTMGDISDAIFSAHGEFIGGMAAVITAVCAAEAK